MATKDFVDFNMDFSEKTVSNSIAMFIDSDAIKESLRNIILTPKGSGLMEPFHGSNVWNFQWEPNDEISRDSLSRTVRQDVENQEDRVIVDDVNTSQISDTAVRIDLNYTEKSTGLTKSISIKIEIGQA